MKYKKEKNRGNRKRERPLKITSSLEIAVPEAYPNRVAAVESSLTRSAGFSDLN